MTHVNPDGLRGAKKKAKGLKKKELLLLKTAGFLMEALDLLAGTVRTEDLTMTKKKNQYNKMVKIRIWITMICQEKEQNES